MKISIAVVIFLMAIYLILLILLGAGVETGSIITPIRTSAWWNLALFPIIIMFTVYGLSGKLIVGNEPRFPDFSGEAQFKYQARRSIHLNTAVITLAVLVSMLINAFLFLFWIESLNPLSSLIVHGIIWFVLYFFYCFVSEFSKVLLWKKYCDCDFHTEIDKSFTLKYQMILSTYVKIGIVKTLPFLLGLTCGFIIRQAINKIVELFKLIGVAQID